MSCKHFNITEREKIYFYPGKSLACRKIRPLANIKVARGVTVREFSQETLSAS